MGKNWGEQSIETQGESSPNQMEETCSRQKKDNVSRVIPKKNWENSSGKNLRLMWPRPDPQDSLNELSFRNPL